MMVSNIMLQRYLSLYFIFFFKQKTAYEMRISDWSSDVCSSDLAIAMSPVRSTGDMAMASTPTPTLTLSGTFDLSRMFMPPIEWELPWSAAAALAPAAIAP